MEGCTVELVEVPDQAYAFGIHFQVYKRGREEGYGGEEGTLWPQGTKGGSAETLL